jgi:hypothetical protein
VLSEEASVQQQLRAHMPEDSAALTAALEEDRSKWSNFLDAAVAMVTWSYASHSAKVASDLA